MSFDLNEFKIRLFFFFPHHNKSTFGAIFNGTLMKGERAGFSAAFLQTEQNRGVCGGGACVSGAGPLSTNHSSLPGYVTLQFIHFHDIMS